MTSVWDLDPTLDERLTKWRAEGFSFQVIANLLGLTRNSVIGRAQRQKLAKPNQTRRASKQTNRQEPDMPKAEPIEPTNPMRLLDTQNALRECRWPIESACEPMCCGAPTVEGTSWCIRHLKIVLPRQREAAA